MDPDQGQAGRLGLSAQPRRGHLLGYRRWWPCTPFGRHGMVLRCPRTRLVPRPSLGRCPERRGDTLLNFLEKPARAIGKIGPGLASAFPKNARAAHYSDPARGQVRIAFAVEDALCAALFLSPKPVALSGRTLADLLGQPFHKPVQSGRPEQDRPNAGPPQCRPDRLRLLWAWAQHHRPSQIGRMCDGFRLGGEGSGRTQ